MWRWFLDAHRLLGAIVEVVDDRLTVLTGPAGVLGRDFPPPVAAAVRQVVQASLTDATAGSVAIGGYRFASAPIAAAGLVAGAVLAAAEEGNLSEREVAGVVGAFARAIEDDLGSPAPEQGDGPHKIAAFYELLQAAITSGCDAEVVRTFAEALSVWDEIEVFAYRADLDGRYLLDVSLPGSDLSAAPREIDPRSLPGRDLQRLSAVAREQAGFKLSGETAAVHLAADGGPWIIALNGTADPSRAEHAPLYVAALAHAMNAALGVETARLTWAIMQQFVDPPSAQEAAARALRESKLRLRAAGTFGLFGADGSPLLILGDRPDLQPSPASDVNGQTMRASVAAAPYTAVLEMRAIDRVFTRRDVRLFDAAVGNFRTWLTSAIRRMAADLDRRGHVRSFDQIVDGYVRAARASDDAASLLLLSAHDESLSLQSAHSLIRMLRPQLRPTDLAGRLTTGEVGILLLQTPQLAAQVVARRLARLLDAATETLVPRVLIGLASQNGTAESAATLIEQARARGRVGPPFSE